jgi:hypothetical protein
MLLIESSQLCIICRQRVNRMWIYCMKGRGRKISNLLGFYVYKFAFALAHVTQLTGTFWKLSS